MKKRFFKKIRMPALAALLFSMTFCVFGPLEIFMSNQDEFWFDITDVLPVILVAFATAFLALFAVTYMVSRKLKWFTAVVFGFGIALYIQGNFMFTNYGSLDGTAIDWYSFGTWPVLNSLIWVVLITVPFLIYSKNKKLYRSIFTYVTLGIVGIQLTTLATLAITATPEQGSEEELSLTNYGQFVLSEDENTIVFVLDCFDQEVFSRYTEQFPDAVKELFADFTYYPDTVGGATRTVVALPYIITGQPYTSGGYQEYLNTEASNAKLYDELINRNYDIAFYTSSGHVPHNADFEILNLGQSKPRVGSYTKLTYYTYKLTAFRYFPHVLKESVWMYTGDFDEAADLSGSNESTYVINDALFYQMLTEMKLSVQDDNNCFRLYHLTGAHPPYNLDANSQKVSESSQFEQISGVFNILSDYFEQMKALGIYQNANIIVMADHGENDISQNPLFMVKTAVEAEEVREFTVSNIPVSYCNLHPTLLEMIGGNSDEKSVFELTMEDNAKRYFYANRDISLVEYVITGFAGNYDNTKETGRVFTIFENANQYSSGYELGAKIMFTPSGTGRKYSVKGFSTVEDDFTWIAEKQAVLEIPLAEAPKQELFASMELSHIYGGVQNVRVSINGHYLNEYIIRTPQLCFRIPKDFLDDEKLTIELDMLDAEASSMDPRLLSIAVHSLCIQNAKEDSLETEIVPYVTYGELDPDEISMYARLGFSMSEGTHVWTDGKEAELHFIFAQEVTDAELSINYFTSNAEQRVIIYANEIQIAEYTVNGEETKVISIQQDMIENGKLVLRFELPDAVSVNGDSRNLAVAIKSITISPLQK